MKGLRPLSFSCALAFCWPGVLAAQVTSEQALESAHRKLSLASCGEAGRADEIVVCARDNEKFRLPLPAHREADNPHDDRSPLRFASDSALPRECGLFQGQRRCNLREARRFGYGGGSVPLRVLVMLVKKAVYPEAEIGPPKGYPISTHEIGQ